MCTRERSCRITRLSLLDSLIGAPFSIMMYCIEFMLTPGGRKLRNLDPEAVLPAKAMIFRGFFSLLLQYFGSCLGVSLGLRTNLHDPPPVASNITSSMNSTLSQELFFLLRLVVAHSTLLTFISSVRYGFSGATLAGRSRSTSRILRTVLAEIFFNNLYILDFRLRLVK